MPGKHAWLLFTIRLALTRSVILSEVSRGSAFPRGFLRAPSADEGPLFDRPFASSRANSAPVFLFVEARYIVPGEHAWLPVSHSPPSVFAMYCWRLLQIGLPRFAQY
jgi:hypothetical protein